MATSENIEAIFMFQCLGKKNELENIFFTLCKV